MLRGAQALLSPCVRLLSLDAKHGHSGLSGAHQGIEVIPHLDLIKVSSEVDDVYRSFANIC